MSHSLIEGADGDTTAAAGTQPFDERGPALGGHPAIGCHVQRHRLDGDDTRWRPVRPDIRDDIGERSLDRGQDPRHVLLWLTPAPAASAGGLARSNGAPLYPSWPSASSPTSPHTVVEERLASARDQPVRGAGGFGHGRLTRDAERRPPPLRARRPLATATDTLSLPFPSSWRRAPPSRPQRRPVARHRRRDRPSVGSAPSVSSTAGVALSTSLVTKTNLPGMRTTIALPPVRSLTVGDSFPAATADTTWPVLRCSSVIWGSLTAHHPRERTRGRGSRTPPPRRCLLRCRAGTRSLRMTLGDRRRLRI